MDQLHQTYVGSRAYSAALRVRATLLARSARIAATVGARSSERGEDEVSEEIVVYGESDPGGGGVDVLTLDPWMFEFHIDIFVPPTTLPDPGPGDGGDTPEVDPCDQLSHALDSLKASRAADETALEALDELIAAADSQAERRALRAEKRQTKQSLEETEQAISDLRAQMHQMGC